MAGLFGTLDLSARALQINQRGLGVTAHNIANVNTPGYTRQRQQLETGLPVPDAAGTIGTGVTQKSIQRIHDTFMQSRLIQEHASFGKFEAESSALRQLDALYNEQSGDGITPQLSRLYDAFDELAAATTSGQPTERANLFGAAETLTKTFNRFDSQMRDLQRATDREIVGLLPEINGTIDRIAELNQEIVKQELSSPANDLRDEQERLIRDLSSKIEVTTINDSRGMTTVLFAGGVPLVEGNHTSHLISVSDPTNAFDPTFSSVYLQTGSESFDVTSSVTGGELGGLLNSRDVHIADAIQELDALAFTVVQTVNDQHNLGRGLVDDTANDFFSLDTPGTVFGSAREIRLSDAIIADLDNIATGDAPGPADRGDNRNATALAQLRDTLATSYAVGDVLGAPTGVSQTVIQQSANMISARGRAADSSNTALIQQQQVLSQIQDQRDEISAVSLDEEVTDLIRLQASYQANARVISTVSEMLSELVRII